MTALTNWAFVVDNKPGAGGNIGMDAVVKAKPDGYTIGMGQTANLAVNPTSTRKCPMTRSPRWRRSHLWRRNP